LETRRRACNN
jgi:hypothetical protein